MIISIQRFEFGDKYTIGKLYLDGVFECYPLEDKVREIKIPKETAIPAGSYKVIIDHSNRFGRDLPHILDVHDFEGVRIHSGNTDKDTEGCILVGKSHSADFVAEADAYVAALQLAVGSAAINAGTDEVLIYRDYLGNPVPVGGYTDIGAFEKQ